MKDAAFNKDEIKALLREAQKNCVAVAGMIHLALDVAVNDEISGYLTAGKEGIDRVTLLHKEIERLVTGVSAKTSMSLDSTPKVLLIDDDPVQHLFVERALSQVAEVYLARNGKVGFDMYLQLGVQAILMDCQMPEIDGFQLTTAIRRYEDKNSRKRTPIIAYTSHSVAGYRERCFEVCMDEYVKKPVSLAELKRVVEKRIVSGGGAFAG